MIETLKNLEQCQKDYTKTHIKKVSEKEEKKILKFLDDLIEENQFGVCVPMQYFGEILKSDKLKNQLELGHGTSLSPEERLLATNELFGIKKTLEFSQYPKYGFILDQVPLRHMIQDGSIFYHYGNIILVLKKEKFLERTTMTIGSSLDFRSYKNKCPMLLTKSNICCLEGKYQKEFYNAINENKLKSSLPGMLSSVFMELESYELQIHGNIIISEDIEKVYLLPMTFDDEKEFEEKYLEKLNTLHIPFEVLSL